VDTQVLQAISGSAQDVKKGQWLIPHSPPYLFMDNTAEYVKRYKKANPPCLKGQEAYFAELLSYLKSQNIKTIVVGMPSMQKNRALLPQTFWDQFRDYLTTNCERNGAYFVDLFDDKRFVETTHYLDTVHLNRWGGAQLLSIIADELSKQKEFVAGLPKTDNTRTINNESIAGKDAPIWH
jgi:hypothetical protein